jgi:GNAT superfamily N-acetyltransferase
VTRSDVPPATRALDVTDARDLALGRDLVEEYVRFSYDEMLDEGFAPQLDYEGLRRVMPDLVDFAGRYAPPHGAFTVLERGGDPLGGVGVARHDGDVCEMNRLWLRDGVRGVGLGRTLAHAALDAARGLGYRRMVLDAVPYRERAIALYRSMGFTDTDPIHVYPFAVVTLGRDL